MAFAGLRKFISFFASCTLCIAEAESVEAEGLSDLLAGGHQVDNPDRRVRNNREDDDGFEHMQNGRKTNSLSDNILTKIIFCCK
jgi:hypothetical protein